MFAPAEKNFSPAPVMTITCTWGYYTNERMKASGWTPAEAGCVGDTESNDGPGAVCFFSRKDLGKEEGLAIIAAEDEKTRETHLFYARIDITPEHQNTSASGGASGNAR